MYYTLYTRVMQSSKLFVRWRLDYKRTFAHANRIVPSKEKYRGNGFLCHELVLMLSIGLSSLFALFGASNLNWRTFLKHYFSFILCSCVSTKILDQNETMHRNYTLAHSLYKVGKLQQQRFFLCSALIKNRFFSCFLFYVSMCAPTITTGGLLFGPEGPGGKLRLNGQGVPVKTAPFQASGRVTSKDPQTLLMRNQ